MLEPQTIVMKPLKTIADLAAHGDLRIAGSQQSASAAGTTKLAFVIGGSIPTDALIESERVSRAIYAALDAIARALATAAAESDPENKLRAVRRREELLACFGEERIHARPIPNGYWGADHPAGVLDPWFEVTTRLGLIVIGWRKRVISIDWSDANESTPKAEDLFSAENVTKGEKSIHAWSLEDAARYLAALHAA